MNEWEELVNDRGVLAAVAEEFDRLAKIRGLEDRIQEERKALIAEERQIAASEIESDDFEKLVESVAVRRVRAEQLNRLCESLNGKREEFMRKIGLAKGAFLKQLRNTLAAELDQLSASKAPHLAALLRLDGVEFGPIFEKLSRGPLLEGGPHWHLVSKSYKLSSSLAAIDDRIRALEGNPASQGEALFEQLKEARKPAPSVLESALGLFKVVS
jgi:uncharacterized protein YhaN